MTRTKGRSRLSAVVPPKVQELADRYLASHGLNAGHVAKAGWSVVADAAKAGYGGYHAPALVIPYHFMGGAENEHWMVRYLTEVRNEQKKVVPFCGPADAVPRVYWPRNFDWFSYFESPAQERLPLTITEGPVKAELTAAKGYPCIALAGVQNFQAKKRGIALIPDLVDELNPFLTDATVVVCYDSDVTTNKQVQSAERGLVAAFRLVHPTCRVLRARLPRLENKKTDLNDFFRLRPKADYKKILDAARQGSTLSALPLGEFLEFPFFEKEEILRSKHAVVLRHPDLVQLHAWRGTGKTQLALTLAGALTTKGEFLRWQAVRALRVLYVEGELPGGELQERFRELGVAPNPNLFVMSMEQQEDFRFPSLAEPEGQAALEQYLIANKIEVVFLDSLSTLANIPMNDEEKQISLASFLLRLRTGHHITVVYLQHDGKGGNQRGHSKHEDTLDLSIQLEWPEGYAGTEGLRCRFRFDKARRPIADGQEMTLSLVADNTRPAGSKWTYENLTDAETQQDLVVRRVVGALTLTPQATEDALCKHLRAGGVKGRNATLRKLVKEARQRLVNPQQAVATLAGTAPSLVNEKF